MTNRTLKDKVADKILDNKCLNGQNLKNKNWQLKKSVMLMTFVCCFSGCVPVQLSMENLIKTPQLSKDFSELTEVFEEMVGNNVVFKYPKFGDYKSPFVMNDIDDDGEEEVIVFYLDKSNGKIKMDIFDKDKINKKWSRIFSDVGLGKDVKKILISKALDQKNKHVIVNWMGINNEDSALTVYGYDGGQIKRVYSKDYLSDIFVFDINNDGKDEVVILDRTLRITPNAGILKRLTSSGEFAKTSYVRLKPGPDRCEKITMGKLTKDVNALFLDAKNQDVDYVETALYTEIIVATKNGQLVNLSFDSRVGEDVNQKMVSQSVRLDRIFCRDVDNDSIIEIPQTLKYHYRYKAEGNEKLNSLTVWQKYQDFNFVFSNLSVENVYDGYSFLLPDDWFVFELSNGLGQSSVQSGKLNTSNITPLVVVYYNQMDSELLFKNNDDSMEDIMCIKLVDASKRCPSDYVEFARKGNTIYCVKINDKNKKFKITPEKVKKHFSITS